MTTPRRRVLVCGGRDYDDALRVADVLNGLSISAICHGDARGADQMASNWAHARGIPQRSFPANWVVNGRSAGPVRNHQMLTEFEPDLVVAFPGGKGTAHMVAIARRAGVDVIEVSPVGSGIQEGQK